MRRYNNSSSRFGISRNKITILVGVVLFLYLTSFWNFSSNNNSSSNNNNSNVKPESVDVTEKPTRHPSNPPTQPPHTKTPIEQYDSDNNADHYANNNNNDNNQNSNDKADVNYIPIDIDSDSPSTKRSDNHDVAIVTLGYTLHSDGMPSKILKDRVSTAVDAYVQLVNTGSNPLLIFSGKGKTGNNELDEYEYKSEAAAMKDLALALDDKVLESSIYLDLTSTNTAENALNTLGRLESDGISRVYVVTSDFHMLRAQYTFQTVFPAHIEVSFHSTPTSEKVQQLNAKQERALMESSQKDLENLGILAGATETGYHPLRNLPRWRMIEREIEMDSKNLRVIPENAKAVDYGSNHGYFSVNLAQKLPNVLVMSLEGEAIGEYSKAHEAHEAKMKELEINNNYLCKTTIKSSMFKELVTKKHVYEYQLCLSVFHWFGMKTREQFEEVLMNHLMNGKTTFIELPEAIHYEGYAQHAAKDINVWYAGRTEDQIFNDIRTRYQLNMTWKTLGALLHDNKTVRKVIRVDVRHQDRDPLEVSDLETVYACRANSIKV
ncbi:hypothetical protein PPL_02776 [Heterostelium album PN500]|uniref:DUF218 domain-containing protein n=1 Tax=Heterostelium pallidum (strain ATCC 26659 / Pp 5 / PN500) TaxID=670386 RepID=D3B311_HETP5|nr:hypothetical protein PPL_02776 [Heterostelium album PN500]EFA83709.1 hypothetical protein PPL_02776 [Heterostelium album PN500]|eukprot:XP_020435826.1 hypothetical protein PPL_02776 [Heterostelium album PN500]